MSWPSSSDDYSGLSRYEYKLSSSGDVVSAGTNLTTKVNSYRQGDNVFYIRAIDAAGNVSDWNTGVYCTTNHALVIDDPQVETGPGSIEVSWISDRKTTSYVSLYDSNENFITEQGNDSSSKTHSVHVIGLKSDQSYRYRVTWTDENANSGHSQWFETSTVEAPRVESLKTEILSPSSALVSFSTNYQSEVLVSYGEGESYDTDISSNGSSSSFSYQLPNLTAGTPYRLKITATTDDGTEFSAGDSFTTPPLPSISGLSFETSVENAAPQVDVSWNTNVDTTSSAFYRAQGSSSYTEISSSNKTKEHEMTIDNLADSTVYEVYTTGIDEFGNEAVSDTNTFTTPLDTRPPKITDVVIETSNVGTGQEDEAQIAISWKTDEPATSYVEYAEGIESQSYTNKSTEDPTQTNSHLVIVSGLKDKTPYHLRVCSRDKGNNNSCSADTPLIPGETPKSILKILLNALENAFGWVGKLL
jgi:hypothetical protein